MIDIHCHLLPEVDDGAETLEEACVMARLAWDLGTTGLVLTPHSNVPGGFQNLWDEELSGKFDLFRQAVARMNNPIQITMGMEVFGTDNVAELIEQGSVIPLNQSRYILLEFWPNDLPGRVNRVLDKVAGMGFIPVVAHPERYAFVQEDADRARKWAGKGYLLQLNKGSILGSFGRHAWRTAHDLLSSRLAHAVASDGHSPYQRMPTLSEAYEYISDHFSRSYAESLLFTVPGMILPIN